MNYLPNNYHFLIFRPDVFSAIFYLRFHRYDSFVQFYYKGKKSEFFRGQVDDLGFTWLVGRVYYFLVDVARKIVQRYAFIVLRDSLTFSLVKKIICFFMRQY